MVWPDAGTGDSAKPGRGRFEAYWPRTEEARNDPVFIFNPCLPAHNRKTPMSRKSTSGKVHQVIPLMIQWAGLSHVLDSTNSPKSAYRRKLALFALLASVTAILMMQSGDDIDTAPRSKEAVLKTGLIGSWSSAMCKSQLIKPQLILLRQESSTFTQVPPKPRGRELRTTLGSQIMGPAEERHVSLRPFLRESYLTGERHSERYTVQFLVPDVHWRLSSGGVCFFFE